MRRLTAAVAPIVQVMYMVVIFAETLYSIVVETDYTGAFFCDVIAS